MIIEQIYLNNRLRNYNYIFACPETSEAAVVDPLDAGMVLAKAEERGLKITKVLNTHEHHDHIGGNGGVIDATGAELFAPESPSISGRNITVKEGDTFNIGNLSVKVLETPGHTPAHVCYLVEESDLFCGDTIFNAGVGNCYSGDPETLYESFQNTIFTLDDEIKIYPGHDYLENNLKFTLSREPGNKTAESVLKQLEGGENPTRITTLAFEKKINTFFRLDSEEVIEKLKSDLNGFNSAGAREVFLGLRELRNRW